MPFIDSLISEQIINVCAGNDFANIDHSLDKFLCYCNKYGKNPNKGQKAHLSRMWHDYCIECAKLDIDPYKYSENQAQP